VTVGDPKQAIYSFRGGDIHTYLAARSGPGVRRQELTTNWRSDAQLLDGLNAVFEGFEFGSPEIRYEPVHASGGPKGLPEVGLAGDAGSALGSLDPWPRGRFELRCSAEPVGSTELQRALRSDLPNRVIDLLDSGLELPDGPLTPRSICVLTKSNLDAEAVVRWLREANIPAVLGRPSLVTQSPAIESWNHLAWVLMRPTDARRVRGLLASDWVGLANHQLLVMPDEELTAWQQVVSEWARILQSQGVGRLFGAIRQQARVDERLLPAPGGDRVLTDLAHVAELLEGPTGGRGLSPEELAGLVGELGRQTDEESEQLKGRSEGDESSVRVMTVHASKGLEFPVTLAPFLWKAPRLGRVKTYFDEGAARPVIDVEVSSTRAPITAIARPRRDKATAEMMAEQLRLAYVALTRAKHMCIAWWPSSDKMLNSPLGAILFRPRAGAAEFVRGADHVEWLRQAGLGPSVSVSTMPAEQRRRQWSPPIPDRPERVLLWASEASRDLDRSVGRWSFSSIVRLASAGGHASRMGPAGYGDGAANGELAALRSSEGLNGGDGGGGGADEGFGSRPEPTVLGASALEGERSFAPMFPEAWAGTQFGTFVHALLEALDFSSPNFSAALAYAQQAVPGINLVDLLGGGAENLGEARREGGATAQKEGVLGSFVSPSGPAEALIHSLSGVLDAPLGVGLGGGSLRDIVRADRLDELDFELGLPAPVAVESSSASPSRSPTVSLAEIARLIAPAFSDHPLALWVDQLSHSEGALDLGGFLNGSIDLVVRTAGDSGPQFHVVDYKTNRLGSATDGLTPYRPDRLWSAMADHHYPLQAILYSVALHRYLSQRLAGYDPARNLGSIGYLFLRGMNPEAPRASLDDPQAQAWGVCSFEIPVAEVLALSRRFADD
jgi:exodeoxyribonuclease V beta subunit